MNPLCLSSLSSRLVWVNLLSVLVVANPWWRSTVAAALTGTNAIRDTLAMLSILKSRMLDQGSSQFDVPDNLAMNGARDTVLQLEVHLGNNVFWEY